MPKSLVRSFRGQLARREQPPVPYALRPRSSIFDLIGGKADNETYLRTYKQSGTIYQIVSTLAVSVATPEWHLYMKQPQDGRVRYTTGDRGSDQRVEVVQHAARSLWDEPNPFHTRFEFMEGTLQHLELCGEGWWVANRENPLHLPSSLWYVRPDRIEPVPDPQDYLVGYVYTGPGGEQIPLTLDQVILIKYPDPLDPFRGAGPVGSLLTNIQAQRYSGEYNRNFFLNGAEPGAIVEIDKRLSDPEFDEWVNRWRESHLGVARAHRVGILENGAKWVDAKNTNRDMEFGALRLAIRDELREGWGVHKAILGNSEDVNRANAQTAEEVFGSWKVIPRLNRIRMVGNKRLLPMFGATGAGKEFDYENPLPDDREADNAELTAKSAAAAALAKLGIWDPDDILEAVGLPKMKKLSPSQRPAIPGGQFPDAGRVAPGGAPTPDDELARQDLEDAMDSELITMMSAYLSEHRLNGFAHEGWLNGHAKKVGV